MKKITFKQRRMDVRRSLQARQSISGSDTKKIRDTSLLSNVKSRWKSINNWIDLLIEKDKISVSKKRKKLTLYLPEKLNFSDDYEQTALNIQVIRKLAQAHKLSNKSYKLVSVNFDNLKKASTSASLVLTAEISKWEDTLNWNLIPTIENWDVDILKQFYEVGFFDLFENQPNLSQVETVSKLSLVRYLKGRCGDAKKSRILRKSLEKLVGDNIKKWMFLRSGLDEAITNVSHHAYPEDIYKHIDKCWYLTGSFNRVTNTLKIVFYDQGLGVAKTLPSSKLWEQALDILSSIPLAERKLDSVLIKAAVKVDRTRTAKSDRGKGLQDMLEFISQRNEGYMSILSNKGLYKFSIKNGKKTDKSESFRIPIMGTLLIWSVTLEG